MRFADTNLTHVTLLPALLLIAACGGGRGDSSAGTAARSPASTAPPPATATPPPAAGTAHYFAYVTNQNDVSVFSINADTGALTPVGAHIAAGTYPNAISVHANGKFAYVTVVGIHLGSSDIPAYTIDSGAGTLTAVAASNLWTDKFPNSMAVHPSGKFAYVAYLDASSYKISAYSYVANYNSSDISAYAINPISGALTAVGTPVTTGLHPIFITTARTIE